MKSFRRNESLSNSDFAFAAFLRLEKAIENFSREGNKTLWRDGSGRVVAYAVFTTGHHYDVYTV